LKSSPTITLFPYTGIWRPPLSSNKRSEKKRREMKFGTEIKFLMIRGTNYLRAKKCGGLK
jgi:hypothetical protein